MSWLDSLEEIRKRDWSSAPPEEREAKAQEVTLMCSYAGAVAALMPVPLADLALLLPVHSVMVMTLGHVHGRRLDQAEARRVVLELGAVAGLSFVGTAAISALKRLVMPGLGGLLSASATFALTWGLGKVATAYFRNPELSREELESLFEDALREGKKHFSKEAFDRFRKEHKNDPAEAPSNEPKSESSKPSTPSTPPDPSVRPPKRTL
jgi:uncharacterized protein (DUF697 family)